MLTKKCGKCSLEKNITEYSRCSAKRDGLQGYCKSCAAQKTKAWQNANEENYKNLVKNWRSNNKERVREVSNKYKKLYYKKRPEVIKLSKKKWRDRNGDLISIYHACRKRRLDKLKNNLTSEMLKEIKGIYSRAKALSKQTGIPHHVDHIVPLNAKNCSGLHVPWNLQIIPASENCAKSNKMPPPSERIALHLVRRGV
jgi:5-methylcytosine-specific restriction endonuclease McrA